MKKMVALLMVVMMIGGLTACGNSDKEAASTQDTQVAEEVAAEVVEETSEEVSDTAGNSDIKIGVVLKTLSSEYWGYVGAGVQAAAEELGVTVDLQGPASETSYDEQNNMIETMLSSGDLDAFVLSPLQPESVSAVLGDTSVPVLFVDTDAEYEAKISYIGTGNYEAAYLGGQYAATAAKEGAKAVVLGGVQGNTTSDEREKGYTDALETHGVTVEAVQYAEGLADKAASIMENLLTSLNNDIDIVVCHNDETASGASQALEQAGITDVIVVGFDGIQAGVQNVIDGVFTATTAQSPYNMGYMAVVKAVAAAKGETVEAVVDTGAEVITSENAQKYLDQLKAVLGE